VGRGGGKKKKRERERDKKEDSRIIKKKARNQEPVDIQAK
jgi:hypothetical protein